MSNALVKQSLSLFEDDTADLAAGVKKKKSTDPMKLISTRKKGVKKELERLKKQQQKNKPVKAKDRSTSRDLYLYQNDEDYTEESVKALRRLERIKAAEPGMASLIVDHHQKNISRVREKHKDKDKPEKTSENQSAFTEDDFDKFMDEFDYK